MSVASIRSVRFAYRSLALFIQIRSGERVWFRSVQNWNYPCMHRFEQLFIESRFEFILIQPSWRRSKFSTYYILVLRLASTVVLLYTSTTFEFWFAMLRRFVVPRLGRSRKREGETSLRFGHALFTQQKQPARACMHSMDTTDLKC
jgi:hypothetical protein